MQPNIRGLQRLLGISIHGLFSCAVHYLILESICMFVLCFYSIHLLIFHSCLPSSLALELFHCQKDSIVCSIAPAIVRYERCGEEMFLSHVWLFCTTQSPLWEAQRAHSHKMCLADTCTRPHILTPGQKKDPSLPETLPIP